MTTHYDVIVAGLGAMGSQAAMELAGRGLKVLGLDRHRPPHGLGSSHGRSRIIRQAYFEHSLYVPLVMRSYEKWRALEGAAGVTLLRQTGGLMLGARDSILVAGAERSARKYDLPFELLDSAALRWRFPTFAHGPETVGLFEPEAGMLDPELAIESALRLASERGAELRYEEPLIEWISGADQVRIRTARGECTAGQLVLSTGPWMPEMLGTAWPLTVERQVMFWFAAASTPELFRPPVFPIWIWEWKTGSQMYGFPDQGDGIKVARHHEGQVGPRSEVDSHVSAEEERELRGWLDRHLPGANGRLREAAVCRYTDAPDGHFVVGRHPESSRVVVVSPCSGHGFKFAPVIGEIAADLVTGERPHFDLSLFAPERLGIPSG
ncbi:MAG TPA: N-methyl-L-tryptophan oxidase [Gemmatimonadales bacterium]|nr:N-methyl-L-tryptophan oxidase [Gemmatimonadales bacterium]